MAKCLVTGGSGFIGSHLVDRLIKLGHYVINIDNESAVSNDKFYKNYSAENHKKDITNYKNIEPLFYKVDYVFHLASDARIQLAIKDPTHSLKVNCMGTLNVLEASKANDVKRIIYASTSSIYHENGPSTIYSISKQFSENLIKTYPELDPVILRYFNVYGDRQPSKGEYATVIGKFIKQKDAKVPLTIVGDGMQTRDFTHIDDVVEATILAAFTDKKMNGIMYDVGTGKNHSILEIAQSLSKQLEFIPERQSEMEQTLANNSKIKNDLGWEPTTELLKWLEERKNDQVIIHDNMVHVVYNNPKHIPDAIPGLGNE